MSLTPKSVVPLAKSVRPCAEPKDVKSTCRPFDLTSATHVLTAFAAQLDPEPEISACETAACALGPSAAIPLASAANPASMATSRNTNLRIRFPFSPRGCPRAREQSDGDEQQEDDTEQDAGRAETPGDVRRLAAA